MQRFYANLLGRGPGLTAPMPKAEALREAKAWLCARSAADVLTLTVELSGGVERGKGSKARPPAEVAAASPPVEMTTGRTSPPIMTEGHAVQRERVGRPARVSPPHKPLRGRYKGWPQRKHSGRVGTPCVACPSCGGSVLCMSFLLSTAVNSPRATPSESDGTPGSQCNRGLP